MGNFEKLQGHLFLNKVFVKERSFSGVNSIKPLCEAWADEYMRGDDEDLTLNLDIETMSREAAFESVATEILKEELREVE